MLNGFKTRTRFAQTITAQTFHERKYIHVYVNHGIKRTCRHARMEWNGMEKWKATVASRQGGKLVKHVSFTSINNVHRYKSITAAKTVGDIRTLRTLSDCCVSKETCEDVWQGGEAPAR